MTQFIIIAVVWTGMAFFFSDMNDTSKLIFYLVTSWLLFLIVIIGKAWIKNRRHQTK
ncbi:hypothetical protein [Virgibacillus ainsalahensis]